jgi:hypothetical protein
MNVAVLDTAVRVLNFELEAASQELVEGLVTADGIYAIRPAENRQGFIESGRRKVRAAAGEPGAKEILVDDLVRRAIEVRAKVMAIAEQLQALDGGEFKVGFGATVCHGSSSG